MSGPCGGLPSLAVDHIEGDDQWLVAQSGGDGQPRRVHCAEGVVDTGAADETRG